MSAIQDATYGTGLEARFRVAARHSRLVRFLRIAVPAAVVVSLGSIILIQVFFNPYLLKGLPAVDMSNLVVSGTKVTMESPHMAGYSQDKRPYEVWANTATQDVTDPDHVELHTLRGKMLMEDQSTLTIKAVTGLMDTKQQLLDLRKDIYLQTSAGYEAWLSRAFVDMNKNTVTSDEHVDVKWADGKISADTMKITNGGEIVHFEGHVVMSIDKVPQQSEPQPEPAPPPLPARAAKSRPNIKSSNAK